MAELRTVESRAVRVTLFEDRAEVVRRATVPIGTAPQWIAIRGPSPYVDDSSVQAKAQTPGIRVLAARVRRRITQENELGQEEIAAIEQAERAAVERVTQAERAVERARAGQVRVTALVADWRKSLARVPYEADAGQIDAWRSAYRALDTEMRSLLAAQAEGLRAAQDAQDERTRAEARMTEARRVRSICEATVEVQLLREPSGEATPLPDSAETTAELDIAYRTPCALWRPEHMARLVVDSDDATKGQVEITTWATAWQHTGELWDEVEASFSTARPSRAASPPLLTPDVLTLRRKTDEERSTVHVEMRDQLLAEAQSTDAAKTVDAMPGVDDGGVPLSFAAQGRLSLASHGHPVRIEIGRKRLDATVARVLVPELAPIAHYRATATLTDGAPLLAGPIRVLRGTALVGRARLPYVASGESFALGFGFDEGLRVRRTVESKREQAALTGSQRVENKVRLYLSNLSDTVRRVAITERIPTSEIEDVQVALIESKGFEQQADGFLIAQTSVPPRETQEFVVVYEVRAKSNVQLG